jgi:signal transduction histidine kinase
MELISKYQQLKLKMKSLLIDDNMNNNFVDELDDFEKMLFESEELHSETNKIAKIGGWKINLKTQQLTWTSEVYNIHEVLENYQPTIEKAIDFYDSKSKDVIQKELNDAIHFGKHFDVDLGIITAKGNHRYVQVIGKADLENGRILGYFQDITKQKQVEQELRETEAQIKTISNNLENGMIYQLVAIDENSRKFTYISDKVQQFYGCTAEQAMADADLIYGKVHKDDLQRILREEMEALKKMAIFKTIARIIMADNTIRISYFISKPRLNNEVIYWDGIEYDITEQKQIELALKESEAQLKELNFSKDKFLSILAHDLKNPFNTLLGYSDLLVNNLRKYDTDKIENQIKQISSTAHRAYNLLEDLLLWSESESGKLPFAPQKIEFIEICNEIINNQKENADIKAIIINCFDHERSVLKVDKNLFKTILRNLVSNAIKFSYKGGKVNISIKKNNKTATIIVSDNGIGIDQANHNKLWDISQKFTTTGTDNEKGNGLGLTLCKEFVEKHGGKIWVESELGKGCDFKFTIPLNDD